MYAQTIPRRSAANDVLMECRSHKTTLLFSIVAPILVLVLDKISLIASIAGCLGLILYYGFVLRRVQPRITTLQKNYDLR